MKRGAAIAVGGVMVATALVWVTARQTRHGEGALADSGGRGTVRFFRNPSTVQPFTVKDLDGREISSASFRDKVTIINFWATWCPPCRAEIPDLVALQAKYRDRLEIIGVSEDELSPADVKRFVTEHQINYPVVMLTPELEKLFPGVYALPTSFVLDRQSRIVQKHVGMLRAETTELETRALAGLSVNASIEQVDQAQGLKLENGAQATNIPGIDLASLSSAERSEALQKLNAQACTCGCDLTVARCRVDDPNCGISLPLARQIVAKITGKSGN
ncbi:MAG TPA: TlpA disulfide reductase family protein [Vicinamibacterales bacterium]|nr:TlpA disulfide reductase family protein [Vicinamibacterales bacterium]